MTQAKYDFPWLELNIDQEKRHCDSFLHLNGEVFINAED